MGDKWCQKSALTVPVDHWNGRYPAGPVPGLPILQPHCPQEYASPWEELQLFDFGLGPVSFAQIMCWQLDQVGNTTVPLPGSVAPTSYFTDSELRSGVSHSGGDPAWVYLAQYHHVKALLERYYGSHLQRQPRVIRRQILIEDPASQTVRPDNIQADRLGGHAGRFETRAPLVRTWYPVQPCQDQGPAQTRGRNKLLKARPINRGSHSPELSPTSTHTLVEATGHHNWKFGSLFRRGRGITNTKANIVTHIPA